MNTTAQYETDASASLLGCPFTSDLDSTWSKWLDSDL